MQQIDQKLSAFKDSVSVQTIVVNQPNPKPVVLESKGNQAQFDHQEKVLGLLQEAKALISAEPESASSKLDSAIKEVEHRIKLIKIADKQDGGWQTVNEYIFDEVADDSDDEKRIRKANNAALAKRKKREAESLAKRLKAQSFRSSHTSFASTSRGRSSFRPYTHRPYASHREGPCFSCGLHGHVRRSCPNLGYGGPPAQGAAGGRGTQLS